MNRIGKKLSVSKVTNAPGKTSPSSKTRKEEKSAVETGAGKSKAVKLQGKSDLQNIKNVKTPSPTTPPISPPKKCVLLFKNKEAQVSSPSVVERPLSFPSPPTAHYKGLKSKNKNLPRILRTTDGAAVDPEIARVEKAIREGHVFEIRGQVNPVIRETLINRGWIEKPSSPKHPLKQLTASHTRQQIGDKTDPVNTGILSTRLSQWPLSHRLLNNQPANFVWADWIHSIFWPETPDWQICNKHLQDGSSKKKLVELIQNLQWVGSEDNTGISAFPRSYLLYFEDEKQAFLQDYRLTSCISLLKWFVNTVDAEAKGGKDNKSIIFKVKDRNQPSKTWSVSKLLRVVDFALSQVKHYIKVRKHEDLDYTERSGSGNKDGALNSTEWNTFLNQCYQITHDKVKFEEKSQDGGTADKGKKRFDSATQALAEIDPFWPQLHIDGVRNIWIFKPGNGSLGAGIVIFDKYEEIAKKFLTGDTTHCNFICQKYIERPLLLYHTKFDLRQWFLVASWNPLIAFFYKKCYLRMSSHVFNLNDLDEKIHLTNNKIQTKYSIDPERDPALPLDNTWTCTQFKSYLKKLGYASKWSEVIYPGMKESILAILLATRESREHRPGSFHIQGADFLISDNFRPWLIEVNSKPIFATNRPITAKMSRQCLIDTIKVILDWKGEANPNADIGDYELLYRGKTALPPKMEVVFDDPDLIVRGQNVSRSHSQGSIKSLSTSKSKTKSLSSDSTESQKLFKASQRVNSWIQKT